MPQMNKQEKFPGKKLNDMDATKLPDAEFKTMVIRILKNLIQEWMISVGA